MCKIISSDLIIGNFIIEAVAKNDFKVEIGAIQKFDEELSQRLIKYDYYTNFSMTSVACFAEYYSFLIESLDEQYIKILNDEANEDRFAQKLNRYFRFGMPRIVIDEMHSVLQNLLG